MKVLRILAMAVFLVTTVVSTASASGTAVGFIPMLSHVDQNVPMRVQARQAFDRMMPKLSALKRSGVISEFEPSLSVGIVKVKYSAAARSSTLGGLQIYSDMRTAMTAAPQVKSVPVHAPLSDLSSAPFINPLVYDNCFYADGLGANSHVVGKLQDKLLRVVSTYQGDADASGIINWDCFFWDGSYADFNPGYKVTFKVYTDNTLTTLVGGPYTAVVPMIKFTSINNATAVVTGTGPASKGFGVYWSHPNLNAGNTKTTNALYGTISAAGTWSKDMSAGGFRGLDYLDAWVSMSPNITFDRDMQVPNVNCRIGGNYCVLHGFAFQPASLSITHGGATYTSLGKFDGLGYFYDELLVNGEPILLKAGDKVAGTSVAAFTLPAMSVAAINFTTNVVKGKVLPSKYFSVRVNRPYIDIYSWYTLWTHSDGLGNYAADFTSQVDLVDKVATNVDLYLINPSTGNSTDYGFSYGP